MLVVVRALRDASGNFRGIVHGMVNLDYYRNQFKALNLGASGIIALLRSDTHALVARFPEMAERINRPLPLDHPVVRAMANAPRDLSELRLQFKAPESDVSRVMGIRKMQHYPFYFAVAFGLDDVLAGWWSQASVVVGSTVLLFALVGLLLWRLARMRQTRNRDAEHLGEERIAISRTGADGAGRHLPSGLRRALYLRQ